MRLLLSALVLACPVPLAAQSVAVATTSGGPHSRSSVMVTAAFGQPVRINQMVLRPVAIVQDSRCPANVNCVWAGQLTVEFATAGRDRIRLEMGKPLAIAGGRLVLLGANPEPIAGKPIPPQSYRFRLRFERR
jgi:hypothetical protein